MQFLYVDISDYPVTREGIYQACYDEVVAEAKDTGDFPMYGAEMLLSAAKYKQDELIQHMLKVLA